MPLNAFNDRDTKRIADSLRYTESQRDRTGGQRVDPRHPQLMGRLARITGCTLATGYATIQFLTGDPGGTLTLDTTLTVKAFIGKNSWWRKDDDVIVVPVACPNVTWCVVGGITNSTLYRKPGDVAQGGDGSTLANPQDTPSAESYCTETVVVP